jgi:hypothetical protein
VLAPSHYVSPYRSDGRVISAAAGERVSSI